MNAMFLLTTPITLTDIAAMAKAGANALLFGCEPFSVRCAGCFPLSQLAEIKKTCMAYHVEMSVAVNRFFSETQLPQLQDFLVLLKELDVDGIYFSDEAVLAYGQALGITDKLIYQPDTLMTNHADVNFYLGEGIKRVVLAREITLEEILAIAKQCDPTRLEIIIHGYSTAMYSRRQLLSNYMKFLGWDRSLQKQRDLMIEEATRQERMPIYEDENGTHIFSVAVQQSFQELECLSEAGIHTARIDGIFHSGKEICKVVELYDQFRRKKIDAETALSCYREYFPDEPSDCGFYYRPTSTTK